MSKRGVLMTTDDKVELGQKIAGRLVGITPSEWSKWSSYASKNGIKKAIRFAQAMQKSPSLRPGPRQAYLTISRVMLSFRKDLECLSQDDLTEVLGYVRQAIIGRGVVNT